MEYQPMVDFIGMAGLLLLFVCIAALEARYRKRKIQRGWKSPETFLTEARHWQRVDFVDTNGAYFRGILAGMVNPARIRQWRLTPYVRLD